MTPCLAPPSFQRLYWTMLLDVKHFLNHTCQLMWLTAWLPFVESALLPDWFLFLSFYPQNLSRQTTSLTFANLLGSHCLLRSQDVADHVGCLTICLHCLSLCCRSSLCTRSDQNVLEVLRSKKKILFQKMLPYGSNLCLEWAWKK